MTLTEKDPRAPWVLLNSIPNIDTGALMRAVSHFGSAQALCAASAAEIQNCPAFTPATARKVIEHQGNLEAAEEEILAAEAAGASIVTCDQAGYPAPLKQTPLPPPVLYIKGSYNNTDEQAVAIVGTRKCSGYGRDTARELAGELVRRGFTVVSGLAHGVDSAAHQGAVRAGGRTLAVLGTGINVIYPALNARLAEEVSQQGALISEFPLNATPEKWNFPRRNRIIAGLSRGVVVVEAPEKSGALITATYAMEYGREVFAVPGNIKSQLSRGPHRLLRDGAALVESVDDILDAFEIAPRQIQLEFTPRLDELEQRFYDVVAGNPISFDDICRRLNCAASQASAALTLLEMKGLVRQLPGKLFVKHT